MSDGRCTNQNHSKMNVSVRYCAACGEIVNKNIPKSSCNNVEHAKNRKDGNHYCINCGDDLKNSR